MTGDVRRGTPLGALRFGRLHRTRAPNFEFRLADYSEQNGKVRHPKRSVAPHCPGLDAGPVIRRPGPLPFFGSVECRARREM